MPPLRYDIPIIGAMEIARKASLELANQIEDALAGLLINGVCPGQIDVQIHPDCTVICVDGIPRYEFKIVFNDLGNPSSTHTGGNTT